MLDIIIPFYNDVYNLPKTLISLTSINYPFQVYLINDGSEKIDNLNNIISMFNSSFPIILLNLEQNCGPGVARQFGLDNSNGDFVLFLDCGDIIINGDIILNSISKFLNNKIISLSFGIIEEQDDLTTEYHNLQDSFKARIFRKNFIKQYNIHFNPNHSYYYEDGGFGNFIDLIQEQNNLITLYNETPLIVYTYDKNSLTKRNNNKKFIQNITEFSHNMIYSIEEAKKYQIDSSIIESNIYFLLVDLYNRYSRFIKTKYPDFIENGKIAIRIFFNKYFMDKSLNYSKLLVTYNNTYPISYKENFDIFIEFLDDLSLMKKNKF